MTWQDAVNGLFESLSGLMLWRNVWMLWRHKQVRGVSVLTQAFFTVWGGWNLYYYPHLGQLASFVGGLVVVSANAAWAALAVKYARGGRW